jgi:hypothetical protein
MAEAIHIQDQGNGRSAHSTFARSQVNGDVSAIVTLRPARSGTSNSEGAGPSNRICEQPFWLCKSDTSPSMVPWPGDTMCY